MNPSNVDGFCILHSLTNKAGTYEIWNGSISARTTGRVKREIKKAIIPGYGRKGMGLLHPKKAVYNKIYRKTTFGLGDVLKALFR